MKELKNCYSNFFKIFDSTTLDFENQVLETSSAKNGKIIIHSGSYIKIAIDNTFYYAQFQSIISHILNKNKTAWIYCKVYVNVTQVLHEKINIGNVNLYTYTYFPQYLLPQLIHVVETGQELLFNNWICMKSSQ